MPNCIFKSGTQIWRDGRLIPIERGREYELTDEEAEKYTHLIAKSDSEVAQAKKFRKKLDKR